MEEKLDCWEFFDCPRGPGGPGEPCRVATETAVDGMNGGTNGGRVCWAVVGTMSVGAMGETERTPCSTCAFRYRVITQEMPDLADCHQVWERLGYADILTLSCRGECDARCEKAVGVDG